MLCAGAGVQGLSLRVFFSWTTTLQWVCVARCGEEPHHKSVKQRHVHFRAGPLRLCARPRLPSHRQSTAQRCARVHHRQRARPLRHSTEQHSARRQRHPVLGTIAISDPCQPTFRSCGEALPPSVVPASTDGRRLGNFWTPFIQVIRFTLHFRTEFIFLCTCRKCGRMNKLSAAMGTLLLRHAPNVTLRNAYVNHNSMQHNRRTATQPAIYER